MVKGISDVDMYFRYIGTGTSGLALARLKTQLKKTYPSTDIKRDTPSILIDFNKIPINITPYKEDNSGNLSIPHSGLFHWDMINFGQLEKSVSLLRQKNSNYIHLIKILKLWNRNHSKGLKNFDIEKRICGLFLSPMSTNNSLVDWLWTFFQNNGFFIDAKQIQTLMHMTDESSLKTAWLNFIDNKRI